jgi:hypothetical protein
MSTFNGMTAEEYFATTFLNRSRKNRLLSELTKPRKRYRGLDRFCHNTPDLIDLRKVLMYGSDLERRPDFETFVEEHEETVTILSPEPAADLLELPFSEAIRIAIMCPDAVIIVGDGFSLIYGEAVRNRDKFLLTE